MKAGRSIDRKDNTDLVARIMAGDESAQAELYERYERRILIIIKRSVSAGADVENLCHETLRISLAAIKKGVVREPEKLSAFIHGVTKNVLRNYYRKERPEVSDDAKANEDRVDPGPNQEEQLEQKEGGGLGLKALNMMPARYREVLERFYILEHSKQEICSDMKITSKQFNVILHRARKSYIKLYQELNDGEGQ
ncbi:MAG TPA: sigma-70 family RNA polymerase sigma factor [Blastocatellia bacterium]|nr:sigma-70 family RNA polymerase sigma factor [Blastocatellia bacterium]